MSKINILFISNDDRKMAGASHSLYNMIRSVKNNVHPIVLMAEMGDTYDFFMSHDIECIVVPFMQLYYFVNDKNPITRFLRYLKHIVEFECSEIRCAEKVYQLLKDRDIRIVHSNSTIMTIGERIAQRLKAKHVWHVREFLDLDFNITPFRGRKRLENKVHKADATIAITNPVYKHWHLEKMSNSYVLWNAVRSKSEICFIKNKLPYFLFCAAQLSKMKGAEAAIRCFSQSGLSENGYKLIMAGRCSESYKQELSNIVHEYNCEESIKFIGYQKDLKSLMTSATAFLMTSLNEGMGRTTIEAMFYGCPVIARHSGGTVDFMKDSNTGFFFDTEEECIRLIKKVAQEMPRTVILNAHHLAKESISEESYGSKLLNIYNQLIK